MQLPYLVGTDKEVKNSMHCNICSVYISHKLDTKNCWLASTIIKLSTGHPHSNSLGLLLSTLLSCYLQDQRILVGSGLRMFVDQPPTQKWPAVTLVTQGFIQSGLKNLQDHLLFQENLCAFTSMTIWRKKQQSFLAYFLIMKYPNSEQRVMKKPLFIEGEDIKTS